MDAEQVVEKIMADAKAEADKITNEAEEKQAGEQAKVDQQLWQYKDKTQMLAQKAGQDKKAHLLAAARMQIAKDYLAEKRKILDEVFNQAKTQLLNLSDDDYSRLITKLMLDVIQTGDEEVIIDNSETRIDHSFIKQINRRLSPGYKGNLRLSDQRNNIGAGFILKRGNIKTNVSIAVLLDKARNELEIQLAKELFGD